jgi:hypothetical protein
MKVTGEEGDMTENHQTEIPTATETQWNSADGTFTTGNIKQITSLNYITLPMSSLVILPIADVDTTRTPIGARALAPAPNALYRTPLNALARSNALAGPAP